MPCAIYYPTEKEKEVIVPNTDSEYGIVIVPLLVKSTY
jgi:hypothetical protein